MTIGDVLLRLLDEILAFALWWMPEDDERTTPREDSRSDANDKDSKRAS